MSHSLGEEWEAAINGHGISFLCDKDGLELDNGDGCTALCIQNTKIPNYIVKEGQLYGIWVISPWKNLNVYRLGQKK